MEHILGLVGRQKPKCPACVLPTRRQRREIGQRHRPVVPKAPRSWPQQEPAVCPSRGRHGADCWVAPTQPLRIVMDDGFHVTPEAVARAPYLSGPLVILATLPFEILERLMRF